MRLFLKNIEHGTTVDRVTRVLEHAGLTVQHVELPITPDGELRGFGFVDVPADEVKAAVKLRPMCNGRQLKIEKMRAKR